jgi:DNA-binding NarL/FixJ family response regulator
MKTSPARLIIDIGILEEDPMRLVGFQSILGQVPDFRVTPMSMAEIAAHPHIQLGLLRNPSQRFDEIMDTVKLFMPAVRLIVTGTDLNEETILHALARGAKGYVNEAAPSSELIRAIHIVHSGSLWVSRHVMSRFIERTSDSTGARSGFGCSVLTSREKQVLTMLVEGRSNKEIGEPLGIEERTVKAHVSSLMRKVGVTNRIALSTHAIHHSLVSP